jgi:hypothetical protein
MLLCLIITTSCTSAPLKKSPEIWFIDSENDVLFRRKDDHTEYAIPIKGNEKAMELFMCIPSKSFNEVIEVNLGTAN